MVYTLRIYFASSRKLSVATLIRPQASRLQIRYKPHGCVTTITWNVVQLPKRATFSLWNVVQLPLVCCYLHWYVIKTTTQQHS